MVVEWIFHQGCISYIPIHQPVQFFQKKYDETDMMKGFCLK
jgi:hypothetical protein